MKHSYPRFVSHSISPASSHQHCIAQISTAAANQRSVHTTYIYQDILQYLRPSKEEGLAGFDIPANLSREERGLENHVTARFLIPRQHLDAFEKDPNRSVTICHQIHS
jgi:hypothetical protein